VTGESDGPGKGSLFTLRLPVIDAPAALPERAPVAKPVASRTVLIIEDNDDARATMREVLAASGHIVHVAVDGPSGLDAALELRPDVAFIDLGLPGLDGFELARRLRASLDGRAMRLVALTGYGSAEDRRRASEAGFNLHLVKPVSSRTLEGVLAEL
jgi:CheY-like chemotaxis protein